MRPVLTLIGALLAAAAAPPGWFPGAGLLVLPALAAFYALATSSRRPYLMAYALGLVYVLCFSWSLRHVSVGGYVAVATLSAVFYMGTILGLRSLLTCRVPGPVAFGVAVAATHWLRTYVPDMSYPHGQPAHCLYHWPSLLGSLRWGSETWTNGLLAALAAAAVDLWRGWRLATPAPRVARFTAAGCGALALLTTIVAPPGYRAASDGGETLEVACVQPNVYPVFRTAAEFVRYLVAPTERVGGAAAERPVALVVWPETSYPADLDARAGDPVLSQPPRIRLGPDTLLLAGCLGEFADGRTTPTAVLVDGDGRLRGHYEKRRLVPGGEFVPFLGVLPAALRELIEDEFQARFGVAPAFRPGAPTPLLQTTGGVPFGPLMCYDNAFPDLAREHVEAGARLLVVSSNETWYRGGAELDQLEAMAVCRAIETATPVVRSTADGLSIAIDGTGRRLAGLPRGTARTLEPEVLRVAVPLGSGVLPPLAWLHGTWGWIIAGLAVCIAWHIRGSAARLLAVRPGRGANPNQVGRSSA